MLDIVRSPDSGLSPYDLTRLSYRPDPSLGLLWTPLRERTGEMTRHILCLGNAIPIYALPAPEPVYRLKDFSAPCPDYIHPGLIDLARLLFLTPADRRMAYVWLLNLRLREVDPDSDLCTVLDNEEKWWRLYDETEMTDRLDMHLESPLHELRRNSKPHWMWLTRPPIAGEHPSLPSYHGQKRVRIYRLLWPMERAHTPFELGAHPKRNEMCSEGMCVNPHHFMDIAGTAIKPVPGLGKGNRGPVKSGKNKHITAADLTFENGQQIAHCPEFGHKLGPSWQQWFNMPDETGALPTEHRDAYCYVCQDNYVRWKKYERAQSEGIRKPADSDDQESQDLGRSLLDEIMKSKRDSWDPFADEPADPA